MKAKCYDPNWKYRRACETDISVTFKRVRRELAEAEKAKPSASVTEIKRRSK